MLPSSSFVSPMLTDLYQLTMAYAYWKSGKINDLAVFDLFFRKNPFGGEFTIFAGLEEVLKYVSTFRFNEEDIKFLRDGYLSSDGKYENPAMIGCEPEFFKWLLSIDCSQVRIFSIREGSVVFPRVPLMRIEGPLAVVQLLETTMLNLINYASLVATKAARFRLAAGQDKVLLEFGLRRAQGPDGAFSASRYTYLGGFDSTSNVLAGKMLGIPVKGTHAHSFVSSFSRLSDLKENTLKGCDGRIYDFTSMVLEIRNQLGFNNTNEGELASFITYAQSFPSGFLALVDTYDTLESGIPNFLCVAIALLKTGYKPVGIRLDSGDLAYLSKKTRDMFFKTGEKHSIDLSYLKIVASNDINEATMESLNRQGHEVDVFGIGTHLVTCYEQPALGCVYKIVVINESPRIKISQDVNKVTIPGRKSVYRLFGREGFPVVDLMILEGEPPPVAGNKILCRHPFDETKRAFVVPARVLPLYLCVWDGSIKVPFVPLKELRDYANNQIKMMREDHIRSVNPTPYKVSVSDKLYHFIHELWMEEAPIAEIS